MCSSKVRPALRSLGSWVRPKVFYTSAQDVNTSAYHPQNNGKTTCLLGSRRPYVGRAIGAIWREPTCNPKPFIEAWQRKRSEKAAEMAAVVQKEIFKEELGDRDTLVFRAKETREATYANAKTIEDLIMAQLQLAQKDPTQAFKAANALKALSLAASGLERLHATKLRALGLDKENALPDELPVLTFRNLTPAEIKAFQERDDTDEESELGIPIAPTDEADLNSTGTDSNESDDIIVEGEEEEPAKPCTAATIALGGRLVRGQQP